MNKRDSERRQWTGQERAHSIVSITLKKVAKSGGHSTRCQIPKDWIRQVLEWLPRFRPTTKASHLHQARHQHQHQHQNHFQPKNMSERARREKSERRTTTTFVNVAQSNELMAKTIMLYTYVRTTSS